MNNIESIKTSCNNDKKMRIAAMKESKQLEKLVADQRDMIQYLQKTQNKMLSSIKSYEPLSHTKVRDDGGT